MDLPDELYERAIEASVMTNERGAPTTLAKILSMDSVLQFPESKFL